LTGSAGSICDAKKPNSNVARAARGGTAVRAYGRRRQLDNVCGAGIGMHPGTPLVLYADLQRFGFEGSDKGKLEIVGSGFRYFADSESHEEDNFTLVVIGKNRRDEGESVLDVAVKHSLGTVVGELP
jgi:hypothetical protein